MNKRSGIQSKESILHAARSVFANKGYKQTTVREIARKARISVGGIYLYFPNKETLFLHITTKQMAEFEHDVSRLLEEPADNAIRDYIAINVDHAVRKKKFISHHIRQYDLKFMEPLWRDFFYSQQKLLTEMLLKGVKEGTFQIHDLPATALMILFALRGMIVTLLESNSNEMKASAASLCDLVLFYLMKKKEE
jgi:AcrR family transcriptional regulator